MGISVFSVLMSTTSDSAARSCLQFVVIQPTHTVFLTSSYDGAFDSLHSQTCQELASQHLRMIFHLVVTDIIKEISKGPCPKERFKLKLAAR